MQPAHRHAKFTLWLCVFFQFGFPVFNFWPCKSLQVFFSRPAFFYYCTRPSRMGQFVHVLKRHGRRVQIDFPARGWTSITTATWQMQQLFGFRPSSCIPWCFEISQPRVIVPQIARGKRWADLDVGRTRSRTQERVEPSPRRTSCCFWISRDLSGESEEAERRAGGERAQDWCLQVNME